MFNALIRASLAHRLFIVMAAIILLIYGTQLARQLPVDVFPDLNRPTVTLITECEGLAPEEVERLVTFPIETSMNGMAGVERIRSVSSIGLSIVYIEFAWGTDIFRDRQQVSERLALVREKLPAKTDPMMGPLTSIMGEIMLVAMTGPDIDPFLLRDLADWTMRPRLLSIPGIAQVIPIGGEVRQFRVTPHPDMMELLDISVDEVERAMTDFGVRTGGGYVDQSGSEFLIRNLNQSAKLDVLRDLVVTYRYEQPVMLRQIAEVSFSPKQKRGDAGYMGKPAIILSILKQPGSDTIKLTQQIEASLADLQRTMPKGVSVQNILFKQANFIDTAINNVKHVLLEAAIVVAIALFLFLMNVRTTAISLVSIPISILTTAIVFHYFDMSINTMTLGGLAIAMGIMVDDSVVDVENILRRLRENARSARPQPAIDVIAAASSEVRSGIVYATIIIVLVFVPLFALSGVEGRLFQPLGVAYIVALLASLLTSMTVIPVLSYYLLPQMKRLAHSEPRMVLVLKRWNRKLLDWALWHQRAVYGGSLLCVLGALALLMFVPRSFLPSFNEGTLTIGMYFNPGISLVESNRLGSLAEQRILMVPEVKSVGRRTGRAELDEHAEGVHASEIDIDLNPSNRSRAEILQDIRDQLAILPASVNIGQPISHRLDHMLSGVRAQIALKLFGDDLDLLVSEGEKLRRRLSSIPGLVDLQLEKQTRVPQIRVSVDPEKARLYGSTPATVALGLERLSNGHVASQVIEDVRRYDVLLRLDDSDRRFLGLSNVLVETPSGRVPLRNMATVLSTDGPNQIMRDNGRRRLVILANTDGSDMHRIVTDIRNSLATAALPQGFAVSVEGQFQAQEEASSTILMLSAGSLALIFLVLYTRYRSAALSLIIMAGIPLSLVGGVLALSIFDQPLSVASMVGFVSLAGISTRNGILKVSHYLNLIMHEGASFSWETIVRGSLDRMTPVLMTASAAGFALLPLIVDPGAPGKEILSPVATVIFGGLISATLLDAVLTPLLFLRVGESALAALTTVEGRLATKETF
jgi:heavy-metal exporter, HME family